jgi:uncharacterized protein (TIGR04255 family)
MQFKKAPLIELIAEFRWLASGAVAMPGQGHEIAQSIQAVPLSDPNRYEQFFSDFSVEIAGQGYIRTERLVPAGWPFPLQMPVCRFRHSNLDTQSTVYQVGAGLFSVHATPPYRNWESFKPVISTGLNALLKTRSSDERDSKFNLITLRYLDRFGPELTGGLSPRDFVEQVFRIRLDLPEALKKEASNERTIEPTLFLKIPLKSGLLMTLGINPATQPPSSGIVLDTTVRSQSSVSCDFNAVMDTLEDAHLSIRNVFTGLTEPIYQTMEPQ